MTGVIFSLALKGSNNIPRSSVVLIIPAGMFMAVVVVTGNTLNTVSPELLPTRARGSGVALFLTIGRLGNMSSQVVNSFLSEGKAFLLCIIASSFLALATALSFRTRIEAKGKVLERVSSGMYDNDKNQT